MIVSSTYTLGTIQPEGRRWCIELHTDQIGKIHRHEYRAAQGADYQANADARAALIWAKLVANEIASALEIDATPTLVYATKNDFVPVYRNAYRQSQREECARLATWILNRIDDAWVNDTQVQNAFGLTAGQWTTLKAKMVNLRTDWLAMQQAVGE